MVTLKIFVEGAGKQNKKLASECRQAFAQLLEKLGVPHRQFKIIPCGARTVAFKEFCIAMGKGEHAMLLIDSEAPVPHDDFQPWQFLKQNQADQWDKPTNAKDEDCHLMVQAMEAWLLADSKALAAYFGQGFSKAKLPKTTNLESLKKDRAFQILKTVSAKCGRDRIYHKNKAFAVLRTVQPSKIEQGSAWASRFFQEVQKRCQS